MSAVAHRPPLAYRAALHALSPLLIAHTLRAAVNAGGGRYLKQRLGFGYSREQEMCVWIHAASVGEVNAAAPLIQALAKKGLGLTISTNTASGAQQLKNIDATLHHAFLPWDQPGAVRRFLKLHKPRCALIMETEIWPNLYWACKQANIPICIVNARLSARTLHAPGFVRRAYKNALQCVSAVLARSPEDRELFIRLGAPQDRVEVCGNLKLCAAQDIAPEKDPVGRPYWLAASTHAHEELRLTKIWQDIGHDDLLVIAPRHPKRSHEIQSQLRALNCRYAVRSSRDSITSDIQVYLADTLGELGTFMAHADWVFMGGSLVSHGGQNILEPAARGRAIIVGPHMENFSQEFQALQSVQALVSVTDDAELKLALLRMKNEPDWRTALGRNAKHYLEAQQSVLPAYLSAISKTCGI